MNLNQIGMPPLIKNTQNISISSSPELETPSQESVNEAEVSLPKLPEEIIQKIINYACTNAVTPSISFSLIIPLLGIAHRFRENFLEMLDNEYYYHFNGREALSEYMANSLKYKNDPSFDKEEKWSIDKIKHLCINITDLSASHYYYDSDSDYDSEDCYIPAEDCYIFEERIFSYSTRKTMKGTSNLEIKLNDINKDDRVTPRDEVPPIKPLIVLDEASKKTDVTHLSINANNIVMHDKLVRGKLPIRADDLINGIVKIIENNKKLKEIDFLYLEGGKIDHKNIEILAKSLVGLNVNKLSLKNNPFGKSGAIKFSNYLKDINIVSLSLDKCLIGAEGLNILIKNLPKTLKNLSFEKNNIPPAEENKIRNELRLLNINFDFNFDSEDDAL